MKKNNRIKLYGLLNLTIIFVVCSSCITACAEDFGNVESTTISITNQSGESINFASHTFEEEENKLTSEFIYSYYGHFYGSIADGETETDLIIADYEGYRSFQLIIIKQSTLDKYTKEEIIENNIYDKLYILTDPELKAMDFKIVYTGE